MSMPPLAVMNELRRVRSLALHRLNLEASRLAEIPEEVYELKHIRRVDLSHNHLRVIPERLWELPNLYSINLIGNPIESLPNRPGLIIDLPTYNRCRHQIDAKNVSLFIDLSTWLEDALLCVSAPFSDLRILTIGQWKIRDEPQPPTPAINLIIDTLPAFCAIEKLTLRGMRLDNVPKAIYQLPLLKQLSLDTCDLKDLPDWIGEMNLEHLSAIRNGLSRLPDSFSNLKQLTYLKLGENSFTKLPSCVFELVSLQSLDVSNCFIKEIPNDILRLSQLNRLSCSRNPLVSPPAEVAYKGAHAIRDYWRQREATGVDYLCEAKLIILGEAGAGKTSLARKIEDPNYKLRKDEESTEGIDVIHYEFPTVIRTRENEKEKALQRQFQVNIWDFGGQEIYHATHQFFLTRRSVYVLVCDDRKEDTDFSYWLQVVEMLSDGSPLLIVQNEKQDRTRDINLSSLRARFGNLRGAIATNLETGRGLNDVIQAIRKELENLPHVGVGLPATWKRVRTALEQDQRDYIGLEEYLTICQQHGFTRREDKLQLSGYLHDLGICLHFQDDPLLKNTVVLKPAWGTDAVYRVLDDKEVGSEHGQFTRKQLERIWSEPKYQGMPDELLQLMMKFQLCYALESKQTYIAPQLLSFEQPSYPWSSAGGLVVRYEYGFLPKGIITRFIVAMHHLIAGENLVWKTGVVLERDGSRAEVIEEYSQRRIRVRVSEPAPQLLLAIIDEQLERLHASFPRLQYERYLPCPCIECKDRPEPYSFPLDKLIKRADKNQQIQCHSSGEMVDARGLVSEILPGSLHSVLYKLKDLALSISPPPIPEVFVSYAWTTESAAIVDRLQQALQEHGIRLLRDREEVRYKDSIREFMRRIGQGKAVLVVLSEKYLKSENCMFELIEIAKAQSLRERIFPIVLADANIYNALGRVEYVRHWEEQIHKFDTALRGVRGDNLTNLQEELNVYAEIRQLFDGISNTLRDMNALTPDQHEGSNFDELIRRIRAQLGV